MRVVSFLQVTSLDTLKTVAVPDAAQAARIQANTQSVRMRADGNDPTAAIGELLVAGAEPTVILRSSGLLDDMRLLEIAASATVDIHFLGDRAL